MKNLFKNKVDITINYINFDEYMTLPSGQNVNCQVSETISNILVHIDLDKIKTEITTSIVGSDNDNAHIFSMVLRSGVQLHLKEKLTVNNNETIPRISDDIKSKAEKLASIENRKFVSNFFKNTHYPDLTL